MIAVIDGEFAVPLRLDDPALKRMGPHRGADRPGFGSPGTAVLRPSLPA